MTDKTFNVIRTINELWLYVVGVVVTFLTPFVQAEALVYVTAATSAIGLILKAILTYYRADYKQRNIADEVKEG